MKELRFTALLTLISISLLIGCANTKHNFQVSGYLFEKHISTQVDSEQAKQYFELLVKESQSSDTSTAKRSGMLVRPEIGAVPSSKQLAIITQQYSTDYAALYLLDELSKHDASQTLQREFSHSLQALKQSTANFPKGRLRDYRILLVPGWNYIDSGAITGSDYHSAMPMLEELGVETILVKIEEHGSVGDNALVIERYIKEAHQEDRSIIVASASSAGPAVALALSRLNIESHSAVNSVRGWLNIVGIIKGSPIVEHYGIWPRNWLLRMVTLVEGWPMESVQSMGQRASTLRFEKSKLPLHITYVNYLGIPLSGNISDFANHGYQIMKSQGPNDGLTLLADAILPNSGSIVALGRDHFINSEPETGLRTAALLMAMLNAIQFKVVE